MANMSLAEFLTSARQMLAGLTANAETVAARGLSETFTAQGQSLVEATQRLENEQETLKAALKTKTAELEASLAALKTWQSEANSTVKLVYRTQPEKWLEFGIKAKR